MRTDEKSVIVDFVHVAHIVESCFLIADCDHYKLFAFKNKINVSACVSFCINSAIVYAKESKCNREAKEKRHNSKPKRKYQTRGVQEKTHQVQSRL